MEEKLYNEIKQLLYKGMSYKDIAIEMELSESLVRRVARSMREERRSDRECKSQFVLNAGLMCVV